MNIISKPQPPTSHRNIKIINDIFDSDQSSSQLQIKHGSEDTFDSLFSKEYPHTPSISETDIANIQSQLQFKRQQRNQMINHLKQYQTLNKILMEKWQKLEGGKSAEISPDEAMIGNGGEGGCRGKGRETSVKPRSKRKLSLLSTSFRS